LTLLGATAPPGDWDEWWRSRRVTIPPWLITETSIVRLTLGLLAAKTFASDDLCLEIRRELTRGKMAVHLERVVLPREPFAWCKGVIDTF
jgi:hypothetical protein